MQIIEDIFYTNLTENLIQFIANGTKFSSVITRPKLDSLPTVRNLIDNIAAILSIKFIAYGAKFN